MTTQQPNPFLTRIIFEPQLVENESFGVVADIDPIVEGHYLFYSKSGYPRLPTVIRPMQQYFCRIRSAVRWISPMRILSGGVPAFALV